MSKYKSDCCGADAVSFPGHIFDRYRCTECHKICALEPDRPAFITYEERWNTLTKEQQEEVDKRVKKMKEHTPEQIRDEILKEFQEADFNLRQAEFLMDYIETVISDRFDYFGFTPIL